MSYYDLDKLWDHAGSIEEFLELISLSADGVLECDFCYMTYSTSLTDHQLLPNVIKHMRERHPDKTFKRVTDEEVREVFGLAPPS